MAAPVRDPDVAHVASMRLLATLVAATCGFGTSVVVARQLGAEGKGIVSLLGFLASIGAVTGALGLGEASIRMIRREGADPTLALPSSLVAVVAASTLGGLLLVAFGAWVYAGEWDRVRAAVLGTALIVPLAATSRLFAGIAQARGRVGLSSLAFAIEGTVALAVTAVAILFADLRASGAILGLVCGSASSLLVISTVLWHDDLRPAIRLDVGYVRRALGYGLPIQGAALLMLLAGRVDLLVVAALADDTSAGQYSIGLTIGQFVLFAPSALLVSATPTLASLPEHEVVAYISKVCRTAVAAAMVGAVALSVSAPFIVPFAFGRTFERAVGPAIILAAGAVVGGAQLVLARACATVGRPSLLVRSFGVTVVAMLVLDGLLIPPFGIGGAAVASVAAGILGLGTILRAYRAEHESFTVRAIVPRGEDLRVVLRAPLRAARQRPKVSQG